MPHEAAGHPEGEPRPEAIAVLSDLAASADLRGHRVDVAWTWRGDGARPGLRLLRRRRAAPAGPEDGYPVADLTELFRTPDEPWQRVVRLRFLAAGSLAEGGLLQGALTLLHAEPGDALPAELEVAVHDEATGAAFVARVEEVSAAVLTLPDPGPWRLVEVLAVAHAPGGGPEEPAGVLTVRWDHEDAATPSSLRWEPAAGAPVKAPFDTAALLDTRPGVVEAAEGRLVLSWSRSVQLGGVDLGVALAAPAGAGAGEEEARITLHEQVDADTGERTRSVGVRDLGAAVEEAAYYRLFRADASAPGGWTTERDWLVSATPTTGYGFVDRPYGLLPSVHRYYDEPTPEARGQGSLRRFLQVFGVALDHLRSSAESLRSRHDLAEVRGDLLPPLGDWIGWATDRSAPLPAQRADIRMAPEVYGTVGTLPNIAALATRVTGWPCETKEFVHNLLTVGGPQAVPIRELWEVVHDGSGFGGPVRRTSTDAFDGRPAPVADPGGGTRLFWHANRSGRWELWTALLPDDGGAVAPEPLETPDEDALPPAHADLNPAAVVRAGAAGDELWLLWESDRGGAWDIWARVHDGAAWGTPFPLTSHPAADRRPGVAVGPDDALWAFWESERRGTPEIWSRTFDGTAWTPAVRVTQGLGRDHEPAAAFDAAGRLWLVWRRDEADRARLYASVLDGAAWSAAVALEDGPWRDESPTLARRDGALWLLWSSDRTGRWELWARTQDGDGWGPPFQVTQSADPDKEPAALVDGGDLRVLWRSERLSMAHRSRTVDLGDVRALELQGSVDDLLHRTYDTARGPDDWYARDVVGLYLTPPAGLPAGAVGDVLARAASYLEPFCPATVRLVLVGDRPVTSVDFHTDGIEVVDPIIDEFDDELDVLLGDGDGNGEGSAT